MSDDGPGFDPEADVDDRRMHVGLQNVRERLERVCDGSVEIHSVIGKGTTARIILPKEDMTR